MQLYNNPHVFNGLQKDISSSKAQANFLYDARNIRITAREDATLMSITNERGTTEVCNDIIGVYLGHCVLNEYIIIFTKGIGEIDPETYGASSIYRYNMSTEKNTLLYRGDLGFDIKHPIEAISSYENESIQKVYWTDGLNQPRMINIVDPKLGPNTTVPNTYFDFIPELALKESVEVKKIYGSGEFPAGVIQYAFTYYNKYGQESNIFEVTPLQYISHYDRGASPEEKVSVSFKIVVKKVDKNFDYLRIYSILRTSIDATPVCKRIQDIQLSSETSVTYIDTGFTGDDIDPTELLYKGGEEIIAKTIEQKDGTLFLGNIELKRKSLQNIKINEVSLPEYIRQSNGVLVGTTPTPLITTPDVVISTTSSRSYSLATSKVVDYINTLNAAESQDNYQGASFFKSREYYRLGIQCQYKDGRWSEPCWIGDAQQTCAPSYSATSNSTINTPEFKFTLTDSSNAIFSALYSAGYRKIRPVYVVPNVQDRTVLLQGVVCPTLFRVIDRYPNSSSDEEGNMYNDIDMDIEGNVYWQSSWLFRTKNDARHVYEDYSAVYYNYEGTSGGGQVSFFNASDHILTAPVLASQYNSEYVSVTTDGKTTYYLSPRFRSTEIMGRFYEVDSFKMSVATVTFHSPDLIFRPSDYSDSFFNSGCTAYVCGNVLLTDTYGTISIQTSSPPLAENTEGVISKSIRTDGYSALIAGLFYGDSVVDDYKENADTGVMSYGVPSVRTKFRWPVYMWHKNGSLNNDVNRNGRSAELLKKTISNFRIGGQTTYYPNPLLYETKQIKMFATEELGIIKIQGGNTDNGSHIYQGNIDTMLFPSKESDFYMADSASYTSDGTTLKDAFLNPLNNKLTYKSSTEQNIYYWGYDGDGNPQWFPRSEGPIGDFVPDLVAWREGIRMKYKSSPHLVISYKTPDLAPPHTDSINSFFSSTDKGELPLVEIRKAYNKETLFGGYSEDALKAHMWIPCGPSVSIPEDTTTTNSISIDYKYGDTYFQRFDCLKTYPFTPEDPNQVVEIASFMCETRSNIDGRYDRNRGLIDNTNISPINHNLYNPVYSQTDNFFNYRILDDDYYQINKFPNQIAWTKEKQGGAEVDLWTNITLASTYDLDGSKGEIISLNNWKDQLYCFQNKGISNILFNSRVQIQTSDSIPIEIANNYKVDGYRYISDGVGCDNKWTIKETPSGIYFIDSITNSLYHIGQDINDITITHNMSTWFNNNSIDRIVYDLVHHDLYLVNDTEALGYSEILGQFTSFYDYGGIDFLESYKDNCFCGIQFRGQNSCSIFSMFTGDYNYLLGNVRPWYISFISNGIVNKAVSEDKIFTNIEYRMDIKNSTNEGITDKSFDYIRVENEYQDTGEVALSDTKNKSSNIKKKFRVWRIDVPRAIRVEKGKTFNYKRDRIRNTWCKITLGINNPENYKAELHDINVQYYV